MNEFPCNKCGLCCQHVHLAIETQYLDRGDGTCRHYDQATKGCSIYSERPDICRIDRSYSLHFADKITWVEFVNMNLQVCEILQSQNK